MGLIWNNLIFIPSLGQNDYFITHFYIVIDLRGSCLIEMHKTITIQTHQREVLIDITKQVKAVILESGVRDGLVNVYAQGATAAIMIQENWDDSVQTDVINLLQKMIPNGVWLHDKQDGNGDAHLKSGLVGPSESIPVIDGEPGLSTWQNIFFCEFDGPRNERHIVVTVLNSDWN